MIGNDVKQKMVKLRDITGASFVWCKKALDLANQDFEKAKIILIQRIKDEGRTFSLPARRNPIVYGKVIADVSADHSFGAVLGISCKSLEGSNSEIFKDLLDNLMIVIHNERPSSITELLTSNISSLRSVYKDARLSECVDVEDLLRVTIGNLREHIEIEFLETMTIDTGINSTIFIYCYNHFDGSKAGLCSFLIPINKKDKDLNWLTRSITAASVCYNPLCIHEYTIPESIIEYVRNKEITELTVVNPVQDAGDIKALEKMVNWKINSFLSETVLDKILIPAIEKQENSPIKEGEQIPLKPIKEIYEANGIVPLDILNFQMKINTI